MRALLAIGLGLCLVPSSASAADPPFWGTPHEEAPLYLRAETDGNALLGFTPTPLFAGQVAVVVGKPYVHARIGVGAGALPPFRLSQYGTVGAVAESVDARVCGAAHRNRHRFRLCGGGQAGVMHLRWQGFDVPGRKRMPMLMASIGGDYGIALTSFLDLHAGIDLVVPILGAELNVRHPGGTDSVRTGHVATAFRVGLGFRLH